MKIHLTSDEINLLIYRYLIENGFVHTAFSFNSEANVPKNPFFTTQMDRVPPNALVGFLQKALLYIYLEYHTSDDTGEEIRCEEPFSIFKRHECWCRPLEQSSTNTETINNQINSNLENSVEDKRDSDEKIDLNIINKVAIDNSNIKDNITSIQPPIKKTRKTKTSNSSINIVNNENTSDSILSNESLTSECSILTVSKENKDKFINNELQIERTKEVLNKKEDSVNKIEYFQESKSEVILSDETVTNKKLSDLIHFKLLRKGSFGNGIREVQFSKKLEKPNKLVITWEEGCPELWEIDINSSNKNLENSILLPVFEGGSMIAGTVVSMSNSYIAIGYENGRVTMFSYDGKELISIVNNEENESPIVSLRLSNFGDYLAVGDAMGHVKILKVIFNESSKNYFIELINKHNHNSAILGLCWSGNDSYVLSGCLDKEIIVYDVKNNKQSSFLQEGQILSLKDVSLDNSNVTCIMDGILSIPILNIERDNSNNDLRLNCISKITLNLDSKTFIEDKNIPSQINFVESHIIDKKLYHLVATSHSVYLFDESCSLISSQNLNSNLEIIEIVSIFVVTEKKLVYVGFNNGSVVILELINLRIKSKYIESETSLKMVTTGIGTISINSIGNLVFIGGPNLPAVYIFDN